MDVIEAGWDISGACFVLLDCFIGAIYYGLQSLTDRMWLVFRPLRASSLTVLSSAMHRGNFRGMNVQLMRMRDDEKMVRMCTDRLIEMSVYLFSFFQNLNNGCESGK